MKKTIHYPGLDVHTEPIQDPTGKPMSPESGFGREFNAKGIRRKGAKKTKPNGPGPAWNQWP